MDTGCIVRVHLNADPILVAILFVWVVATITFLTVIKPESFP